MLVDYDNSDDDHEAPSAASPAVAVPAPRSATAPAVAPAVPAASAGMSSLIAAQLASLPTPLTQSARHREYIERKRRELLGAPVPPESESDDNVEPDDDDPTGCGGAGVVWMVFSIFSPLFFFSLLTHQRMAEESKAKQAEPARKRKAEVSAGAEPDAASVLSRYRVARGPAVSADDGGDASAGFKPKFGYGMAPQPLAVAVPVGQTADTGAEADNGGDEDDGDDDEDVEYYYEEGDEGDDEEAEVAGLRDASDEAIQDSEEVRVKWQLKYKKGAALTLDRHLSFSLC
jgi:hypothetical protein